MSLNVVATVTHAASRVRHGARDPGATQCNIYIRNRRPLADCAAEQVVRSTCEFEKRSAIKLSVEEEGGVDKVGPNFGEQPFFFLSEPPDEFRDKSRACSEFTGDISGPRNTHSLLA